MTAVKINTVGSNITNGVTGGVLFIGAAGALAQDSTKLSWDDTNFILTVSGGFMITPVAVASLPAAGNQGRRHFVTDATVTTFGTIVAGSGANPVPVYDDGTNWRIG